MLEKMSDYFEGAIAKYLSAVDADPKKSHQHEIGGLVKAGFQQFLGTPEKSIVKNFSAKQIYIAESFETPLTVDGQVSWYDTRANQPGRSAEYRLYYTSNTVTQHMKQGDFFLIAKHRDGSLLMIFTPPCSTIENQLRWIFGLEKVSETFTQGNLEVHEILLPLRMLLESLGIALNKPGKEDAHWLALMIEQFGGERFPTTNAFSTFARKSLEGEINPRTEPDQTLMAWMEHEEKLFRIYERNIVKQRLNEGFGKDGDHVDEFIAFSLSVQNRRKSRVGHAFEGHLATLFQFNALHFEQGGKNRVTENESRPDFLFPNFKAYHDTSFNTSQLIMLGAKTTCKDRWRQVLSEASRIKDKHLVTLEASISTTQTDEMRAKHLHLVVPSAIQLTYTSAQQKNLMCLTEFIGFVKSKQA